MNSAKQGGSQQTQSLVDQMKRIERANAAAEKKWLEQQGLEAEKKKGPLTDERLDAKIRTMVKEILPENDNGAACRCKYVSDK